MSAINIIPSIANNRITIDPNTIPIKAFFLLARLILAEIIPARKFTEVIIKPRRIEINWEKEKTFVRNKMKTVIRKKIRVIETERVNLLTLIISPI